MRVFKVVIMEKKKMYVLSPHLRPGDDRDILSTKIELEYNSMYHLKNFYRLAHDWLGDEYYEDADGYGDKCETCYWDRTLPDGSKENWIWWRTIKVPHDNQYYRFFLRIDMQVLGAKTVEVMHQGHKFKMNKANIKFVIEGWLQLDYLNKWQEHFILKHFDRIFRKRWFKKQIEDYKWELYKDVYRFERQMKDYLELHSPYPRPKLFKPNKGF